LLEEYIEGGGHNEEGVAAEKKASKESGMGGNGRPTIIGVLIGV
jgi:hypothetical protein